MENIVCTAMRMAVTQFTSQRMMELLESRMVRIHLIIILTRMGTW